jgi:hypothetical protein
MTYRSMLAGSGTLGAVRTYASLADCPLTVPAPRRRRRVRERPQSDSWDFDASIVTGSFHRCAVRNPTGEFSRRLGRRAGHSLAEPAIAWQRQAHTSPTCPVPDAVDSLILDLLEWLGPEPRPYTDALEAWRTSCPRLPVWEDANDRGFVARRRPPGQAALVSVTIAGAKHLRKHRPPASS